MDDKRTKVLIVEDNPGDARLIQIMMSKEQGAPFDLECAGRLSVGLERIATRGFDVILLDLNLPDSRGLDTLIKVRAQAPHVPIVVLTGLDDETMAVEALRAGAQDYMIKGQWDNNLLIRSIRYAIERKQAEAALTQSAVVYRTLFENTGTPMIIIEDDMTISGVNEEMEEVWGYSKDEIEGKVKWPELVVREDLERMMGYHRLRRTDPEAAPRSYEFHFIHKTGEIRDAALTAAMIPGTKKSVISLRDITEQKRAAKALKESEAKYRAFFETSRDCVFITSKEGGVIDANDAAVEFFGYESRDELLKTKVQDRYANPEDRKRLIQVIGDQGFTKDFPVNLRKTDGSVINALMTVTVRKDETGNVIGFQGTAKDITEHKKAEEELRESEEKFRAFMDTASDLMHITDKEGKYAYVNAAMARTLGYSQEELIGMHIPQILTKEAVEKDFKPNWEKFVREGKIGIETTFATKAGGRIYGELKAVAIYDSDGKLAGSRAVIRDLTERKQADKMQLKLITELGLANKELENFAYVVSHDLKAPLRAISSLSEWLSTDYADKLDDAGKEQLALLKGRAKRMHRLIDGILQYSRVGRKEEEKEEVDLNTLVPEVIDMIAPLVKDIDITVANELPVFVCSRTRMVQVFQNLLSNAVKFMDKPEGKVTVGCTEDEDGYWKFSVADNGPGIDEKHYERIFQIFQTLQSRDELESTGVGLTIVKKIVEMYGGKIWLESKVGEGSTFFFTVPKTSNKEV